MSPCTRGRRRGRSALPRSGSPRYGAWYEATRRTLPLRPGQALPARWQARAGPGAPCHRDNRIPRDGHAALAGEGGDGVGGAVLGVMNAGRLAMRASDDVSVACCKGVWWVRSITALALMLSAVGLAVLGFIDNATAQALDKQVANSLRVEWQRTTSLGGRPAIEGYVYNDSPFRIGGEMGSRDRKSTRLNSSHGYISYAVFCLKKKKRPTTRETNGGSLRQDPTNCSGWGDFNDASHLSA